MFWRSLNKMVVVKVLCQVQPVIQIKSGSIAQLQCVYFWFVEVSCLVCKMFPAWRIEAFFFNPFSSLYIPLFSCSYFSTRNWAFKKWLPSFSFPWGVVNQRCILLKQMQCHWKLNLLVWNLILRFEIWGSSSHILGSPTDYFFALPSSASLFSIKLAFITILKLFNQTRLLFWKEPFSSCYPFTGLHFPRKSSLNSFVQFTEFSRVRPLI